MGADDLGEPSRGAPTFKEGREAMGESRANMRRVLRRVIAALAVSDLAYRLFVRESLRRALGIEAKHA